MGILTWRANWDWLGFFGVRLKWTLEELQFFTLDFGFVLEDFSCKSKSSQSIPVLQYVQGIHRIEMLFLSDPQCLKIRCE